MLALLRHYSWPELRHHPWRTLAAMAAITLGVALGFAVALINRSALSEFSQAVRSVQGEPDLALRSAGPTLDEAWYARLAADPRVAALSPVLEWRTAGRADGQPQRSLRLMGVDMLEIAWLAPDLAPRLAAGVDRLAMLAPGTVFLNPAARQSLAPSSSALDLLVGQQWQPVRIGGDVGAGGPPLAVMDIAALQELAGPSSGISRIDLRLRAGVDPASFINSWRSDPAWASHLTLAAPDTGERRAGQVSRAYRVNLTVLALVALFTGGFLVFSVLALSVSRRTAQLALLGVLGVGARERTQLVLAESLLLGTAGSLVGLLLGAALALAALRWLGGDLGGGFFPGLAPSLQWDTPTAVLYGLLGLASAATGGWLPARTAGRIAVAQALKGLGPVVDPGRRRWWALLALLAAGPLAWLPPVLGLSLGAYLAIGLLLIGGIAVLPAAAAPVLNRLAPIARRHLLPELAIARARRVPASAAVSISGVVAALALAVALTVMVASFRSSVDRWLDVVLPADLYLRGGGSGSQATELPEAWVQAVAKLPELRAANPSRTVLLALDPNLPAVALLARPLTDPARSLPLLDPALAVPSGMVGIYVSEAMTTLHGARAGAVYERMPALIESLRMGSAAGGPLPQFFVAGVWRDYARQFGSIAIDRADFVRLSGDQRINDLALYLAPGVDASAVQEAVRQLADAAGLGGALEFASAREIRAISLRIFDRSFVVTYWLQAIAIGIGLFGVAASFSAQVLARRKEFGLLIHLGLTRGQVLRLVALEGLAWTTIGAAAGLALGLGVSLILVHVVNPQSFHWTMDLLVPWSRLAVLCGATVLAGTATAWVAAHAAASREAVMAVKEDW